METIDRAEALAIRIHDALAEPKPLGRDYNPSLIADLAAVLFGDNDDDVKQLRGIQGPVAESLYYMEKHSDDFLLILPDSRRCTEKGRTHSGYAFYTAAILDKPGDVNYARCVGVHTEYLKTGCIPVKMNDVPLATQAALISILNRKDEEGTWDKKYVGE